MKSNEKVQILAWKNFAILFMNYRQLVVLLTPATFSLLFVIFRVLIKTEPVPAKVSQPLDIEGSWKSLLDELDKRHKTFVNKTGKDTFNVFMPRMIIAYAPASLKGVNDVMELAQKEHFQMMQLLPFDSCDELKSSMHTEFYFAGVCFLERHYGSKNKPRNAIGIYPSSVRMKLIFPSELRLYKQRHISSHWIIDKLYYSDLGAFHPKDVTQYLSEGYVSLQTALTLTYLKLAISSDNVTLPKVDLIPFPIRAHDADKFINNLDMTLSFMIMASHLPPLLYFVKYHFTTLEYSQYVFEEKQNSISLLMEILYVNRTLQACAWLLISLPGMCFASLLSVLLLKIEWYAGHAVLTNTPITTLLLTFTLYDLCSLSFCLCFSSMFKSLSSGIASISVIWFLSFLPFVMVARYGAFSWLHRFYIMYLFPNCILGLLVDKQKELERYDDDMCGEFLLDTQEMAYKLSIETNLGLLILLSIFYFVFGMILDQKFMSCSIKTGIKNFFEGWGTPHQNRVRHSPSNEIFEVLPVFDKRVIEFQGVGLKINGVTILDNINFTVNEGEFVMIMGHNGAGKTMLLHIVIGLREPTSGTVTINKFNIEEERTQARTSLGVCIPEMLYNDLTVEGQLMYYCRLRGLTTEQTDEELEKYLKAMEMEDKPNTLTSELSRGMRQYLALCVALVGDTKVVLLDEPSAKMDMTARREMWKLLHAEKRNRTILMISQSGIEADILADRIVMLSNGIIKCGGSPFFLKNISGFAYRVTLYKRPECISEYVTEVIRKYIPNIYPESEFGAELSYTINAAYMDRMGPLLRELDENYIRLGFETCTLSEISINDVFYSFGAQRPSDGKRATLREILRGQSFSGIEKSHYTFLDAKHYFGMKPLYHCLAMAYKHYLFMKIRKMLILLCLASSLLIIAASCAPMNPGKYLFDHMCFHIGHWKKSVTPIEFHPNATELFKKVEYHYRDLMYERHPDHTFVDVKDSTFIDFIFELQAKDVSLTSVRYLIGATFSADRIKAWFNNFFMHSAPVSLNMMYNAILHAIIECDCMIVMQLELLPFQNDESILLTDTHMSVTYFISVNLAVCLCYITTLGTVFQKTEEISNFKFVQTLSGLPLGCYWLSTFLVDILKTIIVSIVLVMMLLICQYKIVAIPYVFGSFLLIFILTGIAFISVNYVISKLFDNIISAYIGITAFHTFGCVGYSLMYHVFVSGEFDRVDVDGLLGRFFRIFPLVSFCSALTNTYTAAVENTACKAETINQISKHIEDCAITPRCCGERKLMSFDEGILEDILCLLVMSLGSWIILYVTEFWSWNDIPKDHTPSALIQYKRVHGFPPYPPMNDDVLHEQVATDLLRPREMREKALVCKNVGKLHGTKPVLNRLTFQLQTSDCCALIGPNASGKTTLMRIIAGKDQMSYGDAFIKNTNLNKNSVGAMKYVGYSASSNSLDPDLTINETLKLFCLIICIEYQQIPAVCENLAQMLGIYNHYNQQLKHCSKGIVMRVNCAIAILKRPTLLCLDFPTVWIDLAGQRMLWKVINLLRKRGTTVIFTSVSVSECESHSTKIAMLYNGDFDHIGPTYDPIRRHQQVYCVYCKVKRPRLSGQQYQLKTYFNLTAFVEKHYPTSRLSDSFCGMIVFMIPIDDATIGTIFEKFNYNLFDLNLETFFITRETLRASQLSSDEKDIGAMEELRRFSLILH